jgi:autotransporter-associated beta strand protein
MRHVLSSSFRAVLCTFSLFTICAALPTDARAQNGTWTNTAGGDYATPGNWAGNTVASGAGNTANFSTLDVSADLEVFVDTPRTIGHLVFGDTNLASAGTWALSALDPLTAILTLDGSGSQPTITVNQLTPSAMFDDAFVGNNLSGTMGFEKLGVGILSLGTGSSLTSPLTGDINLSEGTLRVLGPIAGIPINMADGTTLDAGVALNFDMGNAVNIPSGATVTMTGAGSVGEVSAAGATINIVGDSVFGVNNTWNINGDPAQINVSSAGGTGGLNFRSVGGAFNPTTFVNTPIQLTNASLSATTNSGGNTYQIGSLTGDATSTLNGGQNGAAAIYEVGTLNSNTEFAGTVATGATGFSLTKVGTGTFTLSGTLSYTTVANGLADLRGGVTQVSNGTLALTNDAAIPGGINDATLGDLVTTIDIESGGTLDVSGVNGTYSTAPLQQVIGTGTIVGDYNHDEGNLRPGDEAFGTTNTATPAAGQLTFANSLDVSGGTVNYDLAPAAVGGLVGDYNEDDIVNAADFVFWRNRDGTAATLPNRDPDNSGNVSQDDYDSWVDNFGQTAGAGAGGGESPEVIQVAGGNLSGNAIVDVGVLTGASAGTYTVINSDTPLTGSIGSWTVNWPGRGAAPTLQQTSNQVLLNANALVPPVTVNWRGNVSDIWNAGAAGTQNWHNTDTNAADSFFALDTAQFLDTYDGVNAPTTTAVVLSEVVSPQAVVVDSTLDYTISGSGRISGGASLQKSGTGRLTITTVNDFNGGATISGGVVDLEGTGVLGSAEITLAGGELHAGVGGNFNLNNALRIEGTGNVVSNDNEAAQTLFLNGQFEGTGSVTLQNSSASVVLNGIDLFGDNSTFGGSIGFAGPGGIFLRFRVPNSAGANAAWDLADNGSTISQRINSADPTTFELGSLAGGPTATVSGFQSGSNPGGASIYQIGALNTDTEYAGLIRDGNVDAANPQKFTAVTKVGTGTLTLSGTNTYIGPTTIMDGVLRTTHAAALSDETDVEIIAGSILLEFAGMDTIASLIVPDAAQAVGTWGRTGHATAQFTSDFLLGEGLFNVAGVFTPDPGSGSSSVVPEPTSALLLLLAGLTAAAIRRRG